MPRNRGLFGRENRFLKVTSTRECHSERSEESPRIEGLGTRSQKMTDPGAPPSIKQHELFAA